MSLCLDEGCCTAYEEVRSDKEDTPTWAIFGYNDEDNKHIEVKVTGTDYDEFLSNLDECSRLYAYVRYETGDEMSKRAKFAFITWIGCNVTPLKKAKVSTDKAFVKNICCQFGKEILSDDKNELKRDKIICMLQAAGGAAYGTGR